MGQGTLEAVTTPDVRGLEQLESAVLDDTVSLASALGRCLMLGGYAHHEELRVWALKELDGYAADDELPSYRKVPAALEIDGTVHRFEGITQYSGHRISTQQLPQQAQDQGVGEKHSEPLRTWALHELQGYANSDLPVPDYRKIPALLMVDFIAGMGIVRHHQVGFFDLPEFARDDIGDECRLGMGVHQIESMIATQRGGTVSLSLPMAASLATLMSQDSGRQVVRLYWSVHVSALEGVLDQVRTRLVQLVAELKAAMPRGQQDPTPDQVARVLEGCPSINIRAGDHSSVEVHAPVALAQHGGRASASVIGRKRPTPLQRAPVGWAVLAALAAVTAWIT